LSIKKILLAPFAIIDNFVDRIISLIGAVIFAQFPNFLIHYLQRLGGHIDELAKITAKYKIAAKISGKSVEEYIKFHLNSGMTEFMSSGKIMQDNITRYNELKSSLSELKSSIGFEKIFIFLKEIDMEIFKATIKNYILGFSFTLETGLYALTGLIISMSLYYILKKLITIPFRKKSKKLDSNQMQNFG
jgi:DUF2937 family protein